MSSINKCAVLSAVLAVFASGCELTKKKKDSGKRAEAASHGRVSAGAPTGPAPKIVFAKLEHDLGTISDATPASYDYKFKNTGAGTLIIEKVGST